MNEPTGVSEPTAAEEETVEEEATAKPTASELLRTEGARLTRTHLAELGLTRTMIDTVFRGLDVVYLPGNKRGSVRREDYLDLLERCTYSDDRVRPGP